MLVSDRAYFYFKCVVCVMLAIDVVLVLYCLLVMPKVQEKRGDGGKAGYVLNG